MLATNEDATGWVVGGNKVRNRKRRIVVAVLAVLVLVFGPKKLGWLVPGPDEAVTGYAMY